MFLNKGAITLWCLAVGGASAFSASSKSVAFVGRTASGSLARTHSAGCACPSCVSLHPSGCSCGSCSRTHSTACRSGTALFADVAEEVPAEVEALDGVASTDEAHNVERPARSSLKKKRGPKGKPISEYEVGSMVQGTVRTITAYGAFIDIGASTDGLLHISQLSSDFVGNVNDVLEAGQEVEVRIVSIDTDKGQVALSLLTQQEADTSQQAAKQKRGDRPQRQQQNNRRDDSAVLASLEKKGWDSDAFVEGTVVSTVDFGCFVRIDASRLNSECEGELDGLVHISALASGRVRSVGDIVKMDDKVQVRMKSINGSKVSLTMLSPEEEDNKTDSSYSSGGGAPVGEGAKDWKDLLVKFDDKMPLFKNGPIVENKRK